jgi:hypothetical protein
VTWVMSNLVLVCLETALVSVQDRCTVCAKHTTGLEIILDAPDGTPDDKAHVKAHFVLFGDSANLDTRYVHGLHRMYHRLRNHLGRSRWNS